MRRFHAVVGLVLAAAPAGCAAPRGGVETTPVSALRTQKVKLAADPTVKGPHFVPIVVSGDASLGVEPGGGVRAILSGVRVASFPGGAIEAAPDRLSGSKWPATALPERLGGGFLFVVEDRTLWRADRWLGQARPLFSTASAVTRVVAGLDRVYILAGPSWRAIDGVTGEILPLGPWPSAPTVGAYAAADGWRAVALTDVRGPVVTNDAGATWRPIRLPIEPREVWTRGDALGLRGSEAGRADVTLELRADGQVIRAPEAAHAAAPLSENVATEPAGAFGAHPLLAAVEDGWPLDDGTAIVARDGVLARVRLRDGALVEAAPAAYPMGPSRCHPIALGASLGFVCGEPRGATALFAFDAGRGGLDLVKRFELPRAVLASGNGAVAVRGACDPRATSDAFGGADAYCVRERGGAWREVHIEGAVGGERVVVLADGRFAVVSPPQGNLDAARLTLVEGGRAQSMPIVFPSVGDDVLHVLDLGVWLDGFEERRPGVLGGWIEAAGTMLGIELALDGTARVGALVKEAGLLPMVSGRYGLGWTSQRQGYETTDGGMTWQAIDVPEPTSGVPRSLVSRACGPVGCSAAGWLRIGWGGPRDAPAPKPPAAPPTLPRSYAYLALECTAPAQAPSVAAPASTLSLPVPKIRKDERLINVEIADTVDKQRFRPLGRLLAWGPKGTEWDAGMGEPRASGGDARGSGVTWTVRWQWPFGGAGDAHATAPAAAPSAVIEGAKGAGVGLSSQTGIASALAQGDDASHALLVLRAGAAGLRRGESWVFALEADRAPVEVRRVDGEPFAEIDGAVRVAGRWYLSTTPQRGERTEAILWQIDGTRARELARVPRLTLSPRANAGRLAARSDGRALGYVVDGQPFAERGTTTRWVASIDLDTGAVGEVTSLGSYDLGDRATLPLCSRDEPGWLIDAPLSVPVSLAARGGAPRTLVSGYARMRLDSDGHACVERLTGGSDATIPAAGRTPSTPVEGAPSIDVATGAVGERRSVRCSAR